MAAARSEEATVRAGRLRFGGLTRTAVVVVAAVVVAAQLFASVTNLREYARIGWRNAGAPNSLVRDADLDPLASFAPTAALARAGQTIPPDATYSIVFGNDPPVESPAVVKTAFRFWLEPRPYSNDPKKADWVIAYHLSSEGVGVRYSREVGLSPNVNAIEVAR